MARLARLVVPGLAHHVTQRGNGRAAAFFEEGDYALYRDLLAEAAGRARTEIWAYCLMPNGNQWGQTRLISGGFFSPNAPICRWAFVPLRRMEYQSSLAPL